MGQLKLVTYNITKSDSGHTVSVVFDVGDLSEAETLLQGCKSLGVRGTVTQETTKPKETEKLADKPKKGKAAEPPPPADEDEDDDDEEDEGAPVAPEEDDEDDEEPEPPKKEAPAASGGKVKVTKEMKTAKFRAVIDELSKQGFTTRETLLKVCKKLREQVPAIGNAGDDNQLAARIDTAVDYLGLDG